MQESFLGRYPACRALEKRFSNLADAVITRVEHDKEHNYLSLWMTFQIEPTETEIFFIEHDLGKNYELNRVCLHTKIREAEDTNTSTVLCGRAVTVDTISIADALERNGYAAICGRVFACNAHFALHGKVFLEFDMMDSTGCIRVAKVFSEDDEDWPSMGSIVPGAWLVVYGLVHSNENTFDAEIEPFDIQHAVGSDTRKDTSEEKRVELHLHTRKSPYDAVTDPVAAIRQAEKWGMKAIAITDYGVLHTFPHLPWIDTKIKIILGMEGNLIDDENEVPGVYHVTLLAKDNCGIKNLYRIVSSSTKVEDSDSPVILKSYLTRHKEGLLIGSACRFGEAFQAFLQGWDYSLIERVISYYDYLEIMPAFDDSSTKKNGEEISAEEIRDINRQIVAIAKRLRKPVCATGNVHFLNPEDEVIRDVLLHSKSDPDEGRHMPLYLRSTPEMLEEFSYLGEETAYEVVVRNTNKIADEIQSQRDILPRPKLHLPAINGASSWLDKVVYDRIQQLYGNTPDHRIKDRVEKELHIIHNRGFETIYMAVGEVVMHSKSQGYHVSPRGGEGASLVAYLLGITDINPLPVHYRCGQCRLTDFDAGKEYNLGVDMPDKRCPQCGRRMCKEGFNIVPDTFLGNRGDRTPFFMPSFAEEYIKYAIEDTKGIFGSQNVYHAGKVTTIDKKSACALARAYVEDKGIQMSRAEENRLAQGITGVECSLDYSYGRLFIAPERVDMRSYSPVSCVNTTDGEEILYTHYEHDCMDWFAEVDELSHKNQSMLSTMARITGKKIEEIPLDEHDLMDVFTAPKKIAIPADDPLIGPTGLIGIPEFGSDYMRNMVVELQPTTFEHIVRMIGFSRGIGVWDGNAQKLIHEGVDITDTISCRDDIMQYLTNMGIDHDSAFKIMECVRKHRTLNPSQIQMMASSGVPQWYVDSCRKIEYLITKARAVSLALTAYRFVWYKVYEPVAFYIAHVSYYMKNNPFVREAAKYDDQKMRLTIAFIRHSSTVSAELQQLLPFLEILYEARMRGINPAYLGLQEWY